MARYFFDVHSDSLSHWDDEGADCASQDAIVVHAAKLLAEAFEKHPSSKAGHVVVASIRNGTGRLVCTATLNARTGLRMEWNTDHYDASWSAQGAAMRT